MKRPLSLKDFKNWLSEQQGMSNFFNIERESSSSNDESIGKAVRPKVSQKKMLEKIETSDDAESLIAEFAKEGGTVLSIEGKRINIEVESGEFSLPIFCVKIKQD